MARFAINTSPKGKNIIFQNDTLRLTLLTPCLLRLESGLFTDLATQRVWRRDLGEVEYRLEEKEKTLAVHTSEVIFTVHKIKNKVTKVTLPDGNRIRNFRKGNLGGTARTLDMANGAVPLEKGIMSRSGVSIMDDSASLLIDEEGNILPRSKCRDQYFFAYGHDYRRLLRDFYRLTGPVPLIPKYALGNWWSRYRAYTQEEYHSLMQTFINRNVPITVATIDMDWHWTDVISRFGEDAKPGKAKHHMELFYNKMLPGWTGYTWNTELFPDHRGLLCWLHDKGFAVTLNIHPSQGIRYFEDCYNAVCAHMGKDPDSKEPIPFDIADPEFTVTYFDDVHHPLEDEGVDFWWIDWQQGNLTSVPGLDPLWALNHYHTLDSGRGEKRPLILSRYAGLGSHRYPLGFSGDTFCTWKSLQFQPYFTNTAANAGYTWWSHDIGGHQHGVQDDELYLRWLQYGVFSPINRLHSSNSDFMGKEPWKRSWAVCTVAEQFLRLRHRLIPYLYSGNYRCHMDGTPLCMPMYYVWDTPDAYANKNQYIFGSKLLVCPITSPMDQRIHYGAAEVWLPEGRWTDVFNGQIYRGGRKVTMHRDIDSIPVLAGEGSIVPLYENGNENNLSLDQPLEIHIWRGNGQFTMYDDDGLTKSHEKGNAAFTSFTLTENDRSLRLEIAVQDEQHILPTERHITLCFRDIADARINVNGNGFASTDLSYVKVPITLTFQGVVVTLDELKPTQNKPKEELIADLLTRVQGSNDRKSRIFAGQKRKLPKYIQKVLEEYDSLLY